MRKLGDFCLSLSPTLLVLLAMLVFFNRKDNDRVQSIPSLAIGVGLTCSTFIDRKLRRKKLLKALHQNKGEII